MTSTQRKPNLNHELNTTKWFEKSYVVAIGINKYIAPIDSLNTAVNDAQTITGVLEEKHGFEKLDCLLNEDATLSNIRTLLTRLKTTIGKNDRLIFYFAGHGIADSNESEPEGYLVPQDAKFPEEKTYLSMTDLLKALSEIDCRHVLIILDCCHAGAIKWALKTRQSGRAKQIYPTTLDLYINTPAWQILTSSDEDQKANDRMLKNSRDQDVDLSKSDNHSPFAYYLIQGLQGEADLFPKKGDNIITAEELHLFLRRVDIETGTSNSKKRQTPLLLPFPKKPGKGEFVFLLNDYEKIKGDLEKNSPDPEINDKNNPYRGLESYDDTHADIFFGRTRAIEELCDQVSTSPLTVVLGTSGSGKSSLVKAGLIPHLSQKIEDLKQSELFIPSEETQKHYEKPQHQHAVLAKENSQVIRPGKSPGTTLEKALADLNLKAIPSGIKCLLVIDQFEEVETQCQDEAEQDKFWQQLVSLLRVEQFRSKLSLVLTLRTDFESLLRSKFEAAWENWEKQVPKPEAQKLGWVSARFLVEPMEPQELQEVIEGPAAVKGVYFETKPRERTLVQELVHEVVGMPGALPLLSFALQEIYRKLAEEFVQAKKEGAEPPKREIGWRHYDSLEGGVTESITRRATEEYEALVEEGKADEQTIRNVMLRMVAVGGGELARRQVPLSELEYPPEKKRSVDEVIDRFTKARLLVTGKDSEGNRCVEPAHDALVRVWPKLVEWKREEQANLLLQRRLTPQAQEWKSVKKKDEEQPKGVIDKTVSVFVSVYDLLDRGFLSPVESTLIKVPAQVFRRLSRSQNQPERSREKPVQFLWNADPYLDVLNKEFESDDNWFNQVEAEFVQKSVLKKRWNISLRRRGAIVVILVLGVLLGLSKINEAKTLRESAEINLQKNQSLDGMRDSLEAGKIVNCFLIKLLLLFLPKTDLQEQVRGTLLRAVYTVRELDRLPEKLEDQGKGTVRADFSPDGKLLASAGQDGTVRVWDVPGQIWNHPIKCESEKKCERVNIVRFSRDGKLLAAAGKDGNVRVWDVQSEDKKLTNLKTLNGTQNEIQSISFSQDGKLLAATGAKGTVLVWNVNNKNPENPWVKNNVCEKFENICDKQDFRSVEFSPDSKRLASTGDNDTILLWDREGNENRWNPNIKYHFPINRNGNGENVDNKEVTSVGFSPDGDKLVTAGTDGIVRVWDLIDQKLDKKRVENPTNQKKIWNVSFSSDGKKLATAGEDRTVRLWDFNQLKDGRQLELEKFEGHHGPVRSVSFRRGDLELASAGDDGTVRLWNLQGNESESKKVADASTDTQKVEIHDGNGNHAKRNKDGTVEWQQSSPKKMKSTHVGAVTSLAFIPDSNQLASSGMDGTIRLWNKDGEQQHLLSTYAPVNYLAYSEDNKLLASAGNDGMVQLWNLQDGKNVELFAAWKAHHSSVKKVRFRYKDNVLVLITVGEDSTDSTTGSCKLWPIESFAHLIKQAGEKLNPEISYLEKNSQKGDLNLCDGIGTPEPNPTSPVTKTEVTPLDPKAAKEISELKGHQGSVRSVAFSHDGQTLATSGDDGTIRLWNIKGRQISQFQGNQTAIRSIDFSPDDQKLVSDAGGKIRLWDLQGNLLREFVGSQKLIRSVKFNPQNGHQLASTGDDGIINLWDLQGQSLAKWQADPKRVWDLEFSPDGQQMASAEAGGNVGLWDLQGKSLNQFTGHIYPVLSVAFSPDGKQLVSGCNVGMIRSWSLPDYQMINMFDVKHAEFNSVVYSLDSKLIVSGDNEGNIKMWKLNTQQQSPVWTAHQNSIIRKVAFSPNGNMFATAADDGIVKLWQLE